MIPSFSKICQRGLNNQLRVSKQRKEHSPHLDRSNKRSQVLGLGEGLVIWIRIMKYSQKVKNDIDFGGICGCVYMYIHWRKGLRVVRRK